MAHTNCEHKEDKEERMHEMRTVDVLFLWQLIRLRCANTAERINACPKTLDQMVSDLPTARGGGGDSMRPMPNYFSDLFHASSFSLQYGLTVCIP